MNVKIIRGDNKEDNGMNTWVGPYIPIKDLKQKEQPKANITKSKVLVIDNLSITIVETLDGDFRFDIDTTAAVLSDKVTIPKLDITAKESISFDDDITLSKLEKIIRRCGVLEEYSDYFTNDPEIIINSYTLNIKKEYQFFDEFKEGVLIGEEIFEE